MAVLDLSLSIRQPMHLEIQQVVEYRRPGYCALEFVINMRCWRAGDKPTDRHCYIAVLHLIAGELKVRWSRTKGRSTRNHQRKRDVVQEYNG